MAFITRVDNNQDITIYYEHIGSGKEIVVFHHGNGNSSANWSNLCYIDSLKDKFQLVLIDSRGYGKSSKLHDPQDYNLKSRADDTIAVLDALKIDKAHCLGGSVGASICMLLAKYYPHRFKSYILATPYFTQFDDNVKSALKISSLAFLEKLEEYLGERLANQEIRNTFLANDNLAVLAANQSEWFDYKEYIKYLTAPTLIYCGSLEPSVNDLVWMSEQLEQSTMHIFPGFTHKDAYWSGKDIAPVISNFVNAVK